MPPRRSRLPPRLPRRTLLRHAARLGLGAGGLALVGCGDDDETVADTPPPTDDEPAEPPGQTDVVVIGGGLAGLAAAADLKNAGLDVVLFEAQPQLGGRVRTDRGLAGFPIELGAEFLHGHGHASWNLAQDLNLPLVREADFDADADLIAFLEGRRWSAEQIADDADLALLAEIDLDSSELFDPTPRDRSLGDAIRAQGLGPTAERLLIGSDEGEHSGPIDQISANAAWSQEGAPGADRRVAGGYDQLVAELARGLTVFTGRPVERVEWSDGLRVHLDGAVIEAGHVLVSVSVAVLQAGLIAFDPPLPDAKRAAIDGLGMGRLAKLIAVYDDPPWPDDTSTVLHDGLVTDWWLPGSERDGTQNESGRNNVIIGFAAERFARAAEGLSTGAVRDLALDELAAIFGDAIRTPARFHHEPWHGNPWVRGGYSYVRVGQVGAREALAAPLDGALFFAGEATHPTTPATTQGAIASGRRAAREILDVRAAALPETEGGARSVLILPRRPMGPRRR